MLSVPKHELISFPYPFLLTGGSLHFSHGHDENIPLWPCGFFVLPLLWPTSSLLVVIPSLDAYTQVSEAVPPLF